MAYSDLTVGWLVTGSLLVALVLSAVADGRSGCARRLRAGQADRRDAGDRLLPAH